MRVTIELRGQHLVVRQVMAESKSGKKPKLGKVLLSAYLRHYGLALHTQEFYEAELGQAYYSACQFIQRKGYKLVS